MKQILTLLLLLLLPVCADALPKDNTELERLRNVADSLHGTGRTDSAVLVGAEAITLARKSGNPAQLVGTLSAQGVFLRSLGRIDEALQRYDEALKIVTSAGFRNHIDAEVIEETATLYINLAVLNLDMQHKDEAVRHAEQAGAWAGRSKDPGLKSMLYGVAGNVLLSCGKVERSMHFQREAYAYSLQTGDKETAFRAAAYAMLAAACIPDKAEAQVWRGKCRELMPEVPATMARLVYYQAECSICFKQNDLKGALANFDEILKLDGIERLPFVLFDCYNNMHAAYAGLGDYKDAYNTLLKGNALRDSIWEQQKAESLRELTVKYETKEKELALARSEVGRARLLMWLLGAAVLLLGVVFAFVVYVSRQRRRRMAREVEFSRLRSDIGRRLTEQYVKGLENERERMARELHDGICNDLSRLSMNLAKGVSPVDAAQLLDNCRESVRRISHELMPPEFAYANLEEVVRYHLYKQREAYAGKVEIGYSASKGAWENVSDSIALEVYRIVQEAVGNALKHSGASVVTVDMRLDDTLLKLTVGDNGKYTPSGRRGIGQASMKRRAAAVGGHLAFEADEARGTKLVLRVRTGADADGI